MLHSSLQISNQYFNFSFTPAEAQLADVSCLRSACIPWLACAVASGVAGAAVCLADAALLMILQTMIDYWSAFARSSDPNVGELMPLPRPDAKNHL